MGSILKTGIAILLILIIGSYIVDTKPVSNVLQTRENNSDPIVTGAKAIKQEFRVLTDEEHRTVYKDAAKNGLKKVLNVLNQWVEDEEQVQGAMPKPQGPSDGNGNSI